MEMVTATPLSGTPWPPGLLILFFYVAAGRSSSLTFFERGEGGGMF